MARRKKGKLINGWLVLDKPSGPTSTAVVNRARRALDARKAGHGGTLDPLATGVLPVALGEATKTVAYAMTGTKTYSFTLRWGQGTRTDDSEGDVIAESDRRPTGPEIAAVLPRFQGQIQQVPPIFSAIKVDGQRAYDLAREEAEFELAGRPVWIEAIELAGQPDQDHATFSVTCGKGAYMRSLARDIGVALDCPAHIVALRRTRVGPFREEHAISLESLEALGHSAAAVAESLLPVETALDDIPALALTETEANRLRCGQAVSLVARANRERIHDLTNGAMICAMSSGKAVALVKFEDGGLHPVRVLNL
ncbi:MAG: tRNA pseudouridine(55) synthase TruB [Pseudomonadota bacterium]